MAFGFTYTLPTLTGTHTDFPVVLKTADFPSEALDASGDSLTTGGGEIKAYTSSAKTTQLPIEVIRLVSSATVPDAEVWVKIGSAVTSGTIFIEKDAVQTSQPAVTATYGRNAVWSDYAAVLHMAETGTDGVFVDSTGNGNDTTLTSGSTLATTTTSHPFGGSWPDFTEVEALTLTTSKAMLDGGSLTLSAWLNLDESLNTNGVIGNRYQSTDNNWAQHQTNGRFFIKDASTEDTIDPTSANGTGTTLLNHSVFIASTSITTYKDGSSNGVNSSISVASITGFGDYRIGTYFNNLDSRKANGRIGEVRARASALSSDWIATEFANQDASTAWGTVGSWADVVGGRIMSSLAYHGGLAGAGGIAGQGGGLAA